MSGETRWTDALDAWLEDTGKSLAIFSGTWTLSEKSIAIERMREEIAEKIAHNMFQFVERHGAQGGKHAESEPRSGAQGGSAEPGRDAADGSP